MKLLYHHFFASIILQACYVNKKNLFRGHSNSQVTVSRKIGVSHTFFLFANRILGLLAGVNFEGQKNLSMRGHVVILHRGSKHTTHTLVPLGKLLETYTISLCVAKGSSGILARSKIWTSMFNTMITSNSMKEKETPLCLRWPSMINFCHSFSKIR